MQVDGTGIYHPSEVIQTQNNTCGMYSLVSVYLPKSSQYIWYNLQSICSEEGRKIWVGCFSPALGERRQLWRNGRRVGQGSEKGCEGNKGDSINIWKTHERCSESLHPRRVMSADTQNCFNALNKSHFCATSNLFQMTEETKTSIWWMGNKPNKKVLVIQNIKH